MVRGVKIAGHYRGVKQRIVVQVVPSGAVTLVTRYMAPCHVKSLRWSGEAGVTTTNP